MELTFTDEDQYVIARFPNSANWYTVEKLQTDPLCPIELPLDILKTVLEYLVYAKILQKAIHSGTSVYADTYARRAFHTAFYTIEWENR